MVASVPSTLWVGLRQRTWHDWHLSIMARLKLILLCVVVTVLIWISRRDFS